MFTASGIDKQTGRKFVLIWDKGVLSGDEFIAEEVRLTAEHGVLVGVPGGPYWEGDKILKSDNATFLLLYRMYANVELVEGKLSPLPSIPKGAIP